MKKIIYKLSKYFIPFISLILLIFLAIKRTDGFKTNRITRFDQKTSKWKLNTDVNLKETKKVLSQDFHYLTRGRECFIFESADKQYVLKFFDSSRYYNKYFFPKVKLPKFLDNYRKKHYNRRSTKLEFNLSSVKLAFERLKDDSALLFVNLNPTNVFENKVNVSNKYGKLFSLDINNIFFILQKKCDIFYQVYEKTKDEAFKTYLVNAFLQMVHNRTTKLVIDDDIGKKRRNWGFLNNKVVTIDIGRWYFDEKLATFEGYKKEMLKATKILRKYLSENEPEKLIIVNEGLEKYFNDFQSNL